MACHGQAFGAAEAVLRKHATGCERTTGVEERFHLQRWSFASRLQVANSLHVSKSDPMTHLLHPPATGSQAERSPSPKGLSWPTLHTLGLAGLTGPGTPPPSMKGGVTWPHPHEPGSAPPTASGNRWPTCTSEPPRRRSENKELRRQERPASGGGFVGGTRRNMKV